MARSSSRDCSHPKRDQSLSYSDYVVELNSRKVNGTGKLGRVGATKGELAVHLSVAGDGLERDGNEVLGGGRLLE